MAEHANRGELNLPIAPAEQHPGTAKSPATPDHISSGTPVYWLLGLPLQPMRTSTAMSYIGAAVSGKQPLVFATPNANFLSMASRNASFRENILRTDLSLTDGMPLIWLGRLVGIPFFERVAGSSLLERLIAESQVDSRPVKLFFFGGEEGAAETAYARVNAGGGAVQAAGWLNPGYGSIEDMSDEATIAQINDSGADILVVSLGAAKGHAWIERNRRRLNVPVISHLGAAVNFLAGTVQRAPLAMQRMGLEWLWRIKEEPRLATRYARDAVHLIRELCTAVIPLACWRVWRSLAHGRSTLRLDQSSDTLRLHGPLVERTLPQLREFMAALQHRNVTHLAIDFNGVTDIDSRALGYVYELIYRSSGRPTVRCISQNKSLNRLLTWHRARGLIERRTNRQSTYDRRDRRA